MRVIPRFVYNPEKAERGLEALANILADSIRKQQAQEARRKGRGASR